MKTILIDCRFAALHVGLGRYTRELVISLLKRESNMRFVLLVRNTREEWIPEGTETLEANVPHYSIAEQIVLPRIIRGSNADILFSPHFNVPVFCPVPFVVTVHDLILHRYPNNASFLKQLVYRYTINRAVENAKSIVAVSHFTARELQEMYGSSIGEKTCVVSEGVNDMYRPASEADVGHVLKKHAINRPYFLYVGNAKQHKNVPLLLEAFRKSQKEDSDLLLISAGSEAQSLTLPAHVRVLSAVSDKDLPALYTGARALVTASLYEGYCLPVAEALACGCPVIASNRTAIPETASGHAMLVEPTVDAFAAAFENPPSPIKPVVVGTWEKAAEVTEDVLLRVLNKL